MVGFLNDTIEVCEISQRTKIDSIENKLEEFKKPNSSIARI
jgi:hypothetical protein